ncbi:hypothetical protein TRFO_25980 [Tritrichomonas foetus]|uniref:Uncharacterized protein n=1 Tax=Tritrichomonas foetus TaxID=1144522 RepID=A0A1J4K8S4_9EUKA|nr:hypothetical protein TRFO_25980 [Tritrichomonas foetus]|eukprot:OHT06116.1 hypothetical protein TRFO_25980 [Tritrichomonas foetus]
MIQNQLFKRIFKFTMYMEHRDMPVSNRICANASRERAFKRHKEAMQNIKSSVNTSKPTVPSNIGRNMKRIENNKQKQAEIARHDQKLAHDIELINKSPYASNNNVNYSIRRSKVTLRQIEERERIDRENRRLVDAILSRPPIINRFDMHVHAADHLYQTKRLSIYKKAPPSQLPPMEPLSARAPTKPGTKIKEPQQKQPHSARPLFVTGDDRLCNSDVENEIQDEFECQSQRQNEDQMEANQKNESNDEHSNDEPIEHNLLMERTDAITNELLIE